MEGANAPLGGEEEAPTPFPTPLPLGQEQVLVCGYALELLFPESKQRERVCL